MKSIFMGVSLCLASACTQPQTGSSVTQSLVADTHTDLLSELAQLVSAEDVQSGFEADRIEGALARRETLIDVLDRLGVDRSESNGAVFSAANYIDMRRLRPGQGVTAYLESLPAQADAVEETVRRLAGLSFHPDPERHVLVSRTSAGKWTSRELKVKLTPDYDTVGGVIESSIYELALTQGAGDQQVVDFAEIFAFDVDFQREIHPGDTFEITYDIQRDERGYKVKGGDVLYAALKNRNKSRQFYRFTTEDDGLTDYYDETGKAARKFLMKTPINGARLSSGFGKRRHPVLGYTKMHKGTDFAAPTGTPVYAAGNGIVERASRYGGYGNYVRIKHADGYKTAYAHLSRYGRGVKAGKRVKQGDIIGYVGTTGRSTGPHLHYEVLINGSQVNAMGLKLPTGRTLNGDMLEAFEAEKARIDALRKLPPEPVRIAQSQSAIR